MRHQATDIFITAAQRFAREFGKPIPARCLTVGGESGWRVVFNASPEKAGELDPLVMAAYWNGWPAGFLTPFGAGLVAAGEGANAETLVEWLRSDLTTPAAPASV